MTGVVARLCWENGKRSFFNTFSIFPFRTRSYAEMRSCSKHSAFSVTYSSGRRSVSKASAELDHIPEECVQCSPLLLRDALEL